MLETDNYEKFKKDILQLAGIDLNSYKEKQMRRRINTLITKNNVKTYNDYVALIKKDKEKFDQFINFLTINVSEFYRNPDQWKILEGEVFPALIKKFGNSMEKICMCGVQPVRQEMSHIHLSWLFQDRCRLLILRSLRQILTIRCSIQQEWGCTMKRVSLPYRMTLRKNISQKLVLPIRFQMRSKKEWNLRNMIC